MLEILQHEKKAVGIKQTTKAIKQDIAKVLYVAEDADAFLIEQLIDAARSKHVEVVKVETMKKLGKACGIDVGAAAAAILK